MCRLAYTPGECCCLFSRATGVKLIGVFNAILFFFSMFSPIVELERTRQLQNIFTGDAVVQKFNATHNVSVAQPLPASMSALNVFELFEAQAVARHGMAFETTLVAIIIGLLTGILVNVLMLWGVHIQFCWFLTPWLLFYLVVIVILFVSPVLTIYGSEYIDLVDYEEQRWTILLALFPIGLGLVTVYWWIVVYKHFDFLDEEWRKKMKPSTAKAGPMMIAVYGGGAPNAITPVAHASPTRSPSPTKVKVSKDVDVEKMG